MYWLWSWSWARFWNVCERTWGEAGRDVVEVMVWYSAGELYLEAPDEFVGSQVIVDRLATDRVHDLLAHRVRIRAVSGVV